MKKLFLIISLAVSLLSADYIVNQAASKINFEATKYVFVTVEGEFTDFSGTIAVQNNKLTNINGLVAIDSINTSDNKRDTNLRGENFFFISKFPNIKFVSQAISGDNLRASISIKGIERLLDFQISDLSITDDQVSFTLTSVTNRHDFMLTGTMIESSFISEDVKIIAKITANK